MKDFSRLFILVFCVFNSLTGSAQPGLVGCYPLDNSPNDFSGNNYNGTTHSVTSVPDRFGNPNGAYHFSGTGSYIELPSTGFMLNEFTYSLWCKPAMPAINQTYCMLSVGGTVTDQHTLFSNISTPAYRGFQGGTWNTAAQPFGCNQGSLPPTNQWYHVVVTRNNTTLSVYLNDTLMCTTSAGNMNAGYLGGTIKGMIGTRSDNVQYFVGDIDDVRIFNRVLILSEIQDMPLPCTCSPIPLDLTNDTSICSGSVISLSVSGAMNYQWNPSTGLSSTTGSAVNASPQNSTTYYVLGLDTLTGCSSTAQVTVTVGQPPAQPAILANGIYLAANTMSGISYQWNFMGNPINGATSQFHTADTTGYYTVTVTAGGCSATSNPTFVLVSGIQGIDAVNSISIFPIPAGNQINIEMNLLKSQKQISVEVFNVLGESVWTQLFSDVHPGTLSKQFSTGDLQSGVYTMQIKFYDLTYVNKKVVIEK